MRISLLLLAFMGALGCSGGMSGDWGGHKKAARAAVVEVAVVGVGSVVETLDTHAVVEAVSSADLFPSATGQVLSVEVEEGDVIKRGETLAVLESVVADAGASRAAAEVAKFRRELKQSQELYNRGAISEKELEDLRYQLKAASTTATEARHSLGNTRIMAPFDGVVALRDIRVGEIAQAGTRAFQVVDLSQLRAIASLPERELSSVRVGQPAEIHSAYDEDQRATGVVERISPVVDPTTGTFRVTVAIDAGQASLRPGQFSSIKLQANRVDDTVVVQRKALLWEGGDPIVYVLADAPEVPDDEAKEEKEAAGKRSWGGKTTEKVEKAPFVAVRTPLKLGLMSDTLVQVVEGLTQGERVIVVGQSGLRDSAPVRLPKTAEELEKEAAEKTKEVEDAETKE
jgi:membrane fusion protein (multidrug efflux system)